MRRAIIGLSLLCGGWGLVLGCANPEQDEHVELPPSEEDLRAGTGGGGPVEEETRRLSVGRPERMLMPPGERFERFAVQEPTELLTITGSVVSASEDWLYVRDREDNLFQLRVTPGTSVHREKKKEEKPPLRPEDLQEGTQVRAFASFGEGQPSVREVEVLSKHPGSGP